VSGVLLFKDAERRKSVQRILGAVGQGSGISGRGSEGGFL